MALRPVVGGVDGSAESLRAVEWANPQDPETAAARLRDESRHALPVSPALSGSGCGR
jgi:hypothetical protein